MCLFKRGPQVPELLSAETVNTNQTGIDLESIVKVFLEAPGLHSSAKGFI